MKVGTLRILLTAMALVLILVALPLATGIELDRPYTKFGIKFMYPEGMSFRIETADESVGVLLGRFQFHILYVHWVTLPTIDPKQVDQALTDGINYVTQLVGLSKSSLESSGEDNVKGHTVTYRGYSATLEGHRIGGAVGSWYCDKTTRLFTLLSFDLVEGVELFKKYLAKFDCHPEECQLRIFGVCVPIPGFPIEGIAVGLGLGFAAILLQRRRRRTISLNVTRETSQKWKQK